MAVQQNDFRHLLAGDLPLSTQAQHVFSVLYLTLVAHTGLAGKERLKAFTLQVVEQGNGWDVGIALTTGFMLFFA
ncbi:hypothetical protein Y888_08910 [Mixta calida B021323]|nr:hypothetical protein Y888_08910 [Mixta calida B021323]